MIYLLKRGIFLTRANIHEAMDGFYKKKQLKKLKKLQRKLKGFDNHA